MAGYSKRPLVEKLGIKEGATFLILHPPENYDQALSPLPEKVTRPGSLQKSLDFIQFFTKDKQQLLKQFPELKKHLGPKGILWISWPKGASKIKTDLNENVVREIGLANG